MKPRTANHEQASASSNPSENLRIPEFQRETLPLPPFKRIEAECRNILVRK